MTNARILGALGGALLVTVYLGAQSQKPRDPKSFPFTEAASPQAVVYSEQSPYGWGKHAPGVSDPLFVAQELIGRPTNTAVTINAAAIKDLEVYYEYGTQPGKYTGKTAATKFPANEPFNVLIDKLKPNTRYYYRMRYREPGTAAFTPRAEHFFQTQRAPGSTYTFDLQFDPHMVENNEEEAYRMTLRKMLADKPDFMIDLGDNFFTDRERPSTQAGVEMRVKLLRSYYDILNHSSALMLTIGNHEGEWGRGLTGKADSLAVMDTNTRKRYFPNPEPNAFYTGSTKMEPLVGLRQANYAYEWGDALFIIFDPYWNQPVAPELAGDWSLTLGREQYEWLKKTLAGSKAKYKFVFSHNLMGGLNMGGQMRGGIETVKYLEMGGYNLDGTWGFDKARPGWEMPIHQLLVKYNATIYFHGHDHLYVKQDLDGIVYQEGPQPSRIGKFDAGPTSKKYNYLHGTVVNGSGYIRVRVSPDDLKVDYVQTYLPREEDATHKDGMIADTYTIKPRKFNPAAFEQ